MGTEDVVEILTFLDSLSPSVLGMYCVLKGSVLGGMKEDGMQC